MTDPADRSSVVYLPQQPVSLTELERQIFATAQAVFDNPAAAAARLQALASLAERASVDRQDLAYGLHLLLTAILEAKP